MEKTKNVPVLRFPEFKGEWEHKILSKIFTISAGGDIGNENVSPTQNDIFKYPIYANAEKGKGLYGFSDIFKINENVLTVAGRGVNLGIAHARDHKFYPIVRLLVLKPKNGENIFFFEYCINNLNILLESTGVPQLTAPQISNYSVCSPSTNEQEKIASFLKVVDNKLNNLKKKKTLLEQYKKGVMQKIFSQELRFKDDNEKEFPKWEKKKLGAVSLINPKSEKLPDTFIYIDLESVVNGVLLKEEIIEFTNAPSRAQRLLRSGDVLFQMVRPYQMNNLYFDKEGDYVASTGYAQIRTSNNSKFIFQYLHYQEFVNEVIERCTGTSYPAINSTDLGNILIKLPCKDEQTKIANFLSSIDEKINLCNIQIEKTEQYKKGLLQKMFV